MDDHQKLKIKIAQKQLPQEDYSFSFPLEIRIVYVENEEQMHTLQIVQKEQEEIVDIMQYKKIHYISVDPFFKVLRRIKTINVDEENDKFTIRGMLENQLKDGKTIIEKIDAARALKEKYSKDVIKSLKEKVLDDRFYGVSAAAADTIGSYNDKKDYDKTNNAYEALKSCLKMTSFAKLPHQVRLAVVTNIGSFEKDDTETIGLLEQLVNNRDQSYFVE
jgi:aminopeptidase N